MKHPRNNWRPFVVISLFLGLAMYFRVFLMTKIFEPIAILFWATWRIISSVNQNIYWTILILICSFLLIRLVPFRTNASRSAYRDEHPSPNRVEDWLALMKNVPLGMDETKYLGDRFKRLLISIQQLERFHSVDLEEAVTLKEVSMPPGVHRFLFPAKGKHSYRMQMFLLGPKWFRRWASKAFQINNVAIEESLTWMESLMEITNDQ